MTKDELIELAQVGMGIHSPNAPEYIVCEALIKALAQTEQEPVVGTKTWFEDGKVVTQHLTAKDIYKEPEQEPVEWGVDWGPDGNSVSIIKRLADGGIEVVGWEYAPHPPQRTWIGLTEDEVALICADCSLVTPSDFYFYQAIEAKLKEKNNV